MTGTTVGRLFDSCAGLGGRIVKAQVQQIRGDREGKSVFRENFCKKTHFCTNLSHDGGNSHGGCVEYEA